MVSTKSAQRTELDVSSVRAEFPVLTRKAASGKPLVYFDNAASTQKPVEVIRAVEEFYSTYYANVHRGIHTLSEEATERYEKAREAVARFINAGSPSEIIFVRGTTEAINLVAYSLALRQFEKGDSILSSIMEHHSNIVPWQMMRDLKGLRLDFVDVSDDGRLRMEEYGQKIGKRTRLVTVTQMSNVLGTVNDVRAVAEAAHERGSLCLVDGAQSVPHMPVDVRKIGCDLLAFSGHKMCGPTGIGVLYGKRELLEKMEPFHGGGNMIREVHREGAKWSDLPYKFEAGTPDIAGAIGLGAACGYLSRIGMGRVEAHERSLTEYALEAFAGLPVAEVIGPKSAKDRGGIVSFNVKGVHSHDVASLLDAEGVAIRSGHHCAQPLLERLGQKSAARASFYLYNTKGEVDVMVDGLRKIHAMLGG